ncbi:MAG: hypothetical protein HYR97_07015 [Candidatus Melainabacteria bacterium]|nr:hypothetical protein [Candidatus Melainabacteria bacterium]
MNTGQISGVKPASSLVSITGRASAPEFQKAVKEIVKRKKIEPYFFQEGRFERVAGKGFYAYILVKPDGQKSFVNSFHVPENKIKHEVEIFAQEPDEDTLLVIDGGSYEQDIITSLDDYERAFVLFPPYNSKQAIPISEAKRQVWKNLFYARRSSVGVEKVRIS